MTTSNSAGPGSERGQIAKTLFRRASSWTRDHGTLVSAVAVGSLAALLYMRTIDFGFFGDDPTGQFRWMEGVSWIELFTLSPGFILRPLVFVISKLLLLIRGGYDAPAFHLVPLGLHVANTVLLGVLGSALSRRRAFGWLAALLFATFPLSHEAVAEFDALAHPLLAFWVLLALVCFERGRRSGSRYYLWAVYPIMVLALLSHENGLVLPVLLLGMELIYYPPHSVRELARRPVLHYFAVPALYLVWWLWVPKAATSTPHSLSAIPHNTLPFLQVVAYPLLPIVKLNVTQWGGLLALVVASLVLTYLAARFLNTLRVWLFAIFQMALVSIPSLLFLDWDYLHGGPRLYYLGSVGAALLWAAPPLALYALAQGTMVRRAVMTGTAILLALALVLPPIPFIECQLDLFDQATGLVRLVSTQAAAAPAGRDLVYVNLPAYFISNDKHPLGCPPTYPFVTTGVGVFPPYAHLQDFVWVNGGPDRPARAVTVAEYDPDWPPRYGEALPLAAMRDTVQHNQVYVFEIDTWSLRDLSAAWQPDAGPSQAVLAAFGDSLALESTNVQEGDSGLTVTLQWTVRSVPAAAITAFAHVYDREGKLIAQHDGEIGRNGAPTPYIPLSLWQAGDRIQDTHVIALDTPLPADGYTVAVGLYDPTTLERVPARAPDGIDLRENLYVLEP